MFYNRANIGHVNYALTAFTIILVLSILFSGEPIASSQGPQGPRPVELTHPIASSQGPIQSSEQFRCTDGSLVGRGSDCTSDECPVSASNHLVQCTPETSRHNQENDRIGPFLNCADRESFHSSHFFGCHEFHPIREYYTKKVFNNYFQYTPASSTIPYYVSIFTNKNTYKMGESVEILLKNTGIKPLVFTNANSRLEIRNLGTGQSFLINMPIPFVLSPEETNTITWNQHNPTEQQVDTGNYAVTIFWDQMNSSAAFTISGK